MRELLAEMVGNRQLSPQDAKSLEDGCARREIADISSEEDVLRWLASQYHLAYTDLTNTQPSRDVLSLFPARVLLKQEVLPLRRVEGAVEVATSRLFATEGRDMLRVLTGLRLVTVLAPAEAIRREIKKQLGVGADTLDSLEETAPVQVINEAPEEEADLDQAAEDASIIRFVNQVFNDAIALRATDIHLEPFESEMKIRYRIDGVLQDVPVPVQIKRFQPAIVSRIKILSHLDIAEKRLPQDGRIKVRVANEEVDVRVSIIPMLHGEAVVMRLLRRATALRGLSELQMGEREERLLREILGLPHGIVLVTGPTGSGKTTTLYTALSEINDSIRKIVTIEDPVEYHLEGVNQIQVSEKTGLVFSRGLRSILRHDPDVILVGEIRDVETAQIAVQASLTGHLVFSTLHTNDAPGALTRLIDMGIEPYLVASSVEAVLAQRLLRLLCRECKMEDTSPKANVVRQDLGLPPELPLYRAVGCRSCRHTGYHERRAVFEFMKINEEIRQLVLRKRSTGEIRDAARRAGLRSLCEDGWRLVGEGVTTVDEVLRVTRDERAILANGETRASESIGERSMDDGS